MSIISEIKESYRDNGVTVKLIYINIGIFILLRLIDIFALTGMFPQGSLLTWVGMPTHAQELLFRPWTIMTYMFSHYDFIHIIFNLLCLHWFGRLFNSLFGQHLVLRTYIIGGLVGALFCLVGAAILPVGRIMIGASASILALLMAVAVYAPNQSVSVVFVGNIKLKYYALVFVVIDIISIPGLVNAGGHIAHLGGALAGALLALWWKQNGVPQQGKPFRLWRKRPKMKVVYRRPLTDMEYNAAKVDNAREIDRILDKIKSSGYDSLTKEERQKLFNESKN